MELGIIGLGVMDMSKITKNKRSKKRNVFQTNKNQARPRGKVSGKIVHNASRRWRICLWLGRAGLATAR